MSVVIPLRTGGEARRVETRFVVRAGAEACRMGVAMDANPHRVGHPMASVWRAGWKREQLRLQTSGALPGVCNTGVNWLVAGA